MNKEYTEGRCPECGKMLRGFNKKMLDYNMSLHVQKHKDKKQKVKRGNK